MKTLIAVVIAVLIFLSWGLTRDSAPAPPDFAAAHDGKVILYATSWCGYCEKTRKLLRDNNIVYYEYDIEKSREGNEQHKKLGGGGIPLLLIDGEVVNGYDPARILELAKGT